MLRSAGGSTVEPGRIGGPGGVGKDKGETGRGEVSVQHSDLVGDLRSTVELLVGCIYARRGVIVLRDVSSRESGARLDNVEVHGDRGSSESADGSLERGLALVEILLSSGDIGSGLGGTTVPSLGSGEGCYAEESGGDSGETHDEEGGGGCMKRWVR